MMTGWASGALSWMIRSISVTLAGSSAISTCHTHPGHQACVMVAGAAELHHDEACNAFTGADAVRPNLHDLEVTCPWCRRMTAQRSYQQLR
jgi:hypothetical protein